MMVIGNLGKAAEVRYTNAGKPVVNFSVAVNRAWRDAKGKEHKETEWFQCVDWSGEKIAPYLEKGKRVYVEGRMQTRNWEGKDGKKNYRTELIVRNLILLGGKADSETAVATPEPPVGSEIPF